MRSEALADRGIVIEDGFLSAVELLELVRCAGRRHADGEFTPAAVGAGSGIRHVPDIRGDATAWLREPLQSAEQALLARLESLRLELNRRLILGLFDLEMHYARYPAGTRYARHLDQPRERAERRVSLVLYLNPEWRAEEGGQLRLYEADGRFEDVLPQGGRLVLFRTEGREHEVLPAQRERLSLTGWFRARG